MEKKKSVDHKGTIIEITEGNIRIFLKLKVEYTIKERVSNVDVSFSNI